MLVKSNIGYEYTINLPVTEEEKLQNEANYTYSELTRVTFKAFEVKELEETFLNRMLAQSPVFKELFEKHKCFVTVDEDPNKVPEVILESTRWETKYNIKVQAIQDSSLSKAKKTEALATLATEFENLSLEVASIKEDTSLTEEEKLNQVDALYENY